MNMFGRTRILKVNPDHPEEPAIKMAADIIIKGGLVAFPTETVYGLGGLHSNKEAVKRIYAVKKRPRKKPLTLHISDMDMLIGLVSEIPVIAQRLINKFWPGPLTLILPAKRGRSLGFRMPRNKIALELIRTCGVPIVAPSANPSGNAPPVDAASVSEVLGHKIDMILDGGITEMGKESTIIDSTVFPCKLLREGAISKSRIPDAWYCI